jgi:DivIVA domain-containing protein
MRLTPADVHNVAFKKPSIGKRGYDEDEVDAFLDIVEAELTRLIEENNELRQQVAALESGRQDAAPVAEPAMPAAGGGPDVQDIIDHAPAQAAPEHEAPEADGQPAPEAEAAEPRTAEQPAVSDADIPTVAAVPVEPAPAAPVVAPAVAGPADHHRQAARLLGLAQETAERVTSEANAEAEQTRSSARAESEKMLTDARNESERMLTEAKNTSESMVADATAKADATIRDSEIKAEAMDREAQRKYAEVMNQLTAQRTSLEGKIDGLRTYEREYRSRLKNWITDQLHQLDASGSDATATAGAGGTATETV